jgi:hypothetical protein
MTDQPANPLRDLLSARSMRNWALEDLERSAERYAASFESRAADLRRATKYARWNPNRLMGEVLSQLNTSYGGASLDSLYRDSRDAEQAEAAYQQAKAAWRALDPSFQRSCRGALLAERRNAQKRAAKAQEERVAREAKQCNGKVYSGFSSRRCSRKGSVEVAGKLYCKQHAGDAERQARYEAHRVG